MVKYLQRGKRIRNGFDIQLLPGILFLLVLLNLSLLLALLNKGTCSTNQQKSGKSLSLQHGNDAHHDRTNGEWSLHRTFKKGSICQITRGKVDLTVMDFIHFQVTSISHSRLVETGTNLQHSEQVRQPLRWISRQILGLTSDGTEKPPATEIQLNDSSNDPFCTTRNKALIVIRIKYLL